MSDSNAFFTQAGNFTSAVSGGVDPRTGLWNLSITLGHINGNQLQGPVFPVTLSYSPLFQQDTWGLGIGVSLGMSSLDTYSGQLALSTGEQYQTWRLSEDIVVSQKKLDSFLIERQGGECYQVTHKTGDIEFLAGDDYGPGLKLPLRMVNAAGHTLYIRTDHNNRLSAILDETDTLLGITYDDGPVTLTFYPGKPESYSVRLTTLNGYLSTVTRHADGEESMIWQIGYDDMGLWGQWATSLTSPSGMQERVVYRQDGYARHFPDSAPQALRATPFPCVIQCEKTPGHGQPPLVSVYEYSDYNFLGYGSGVDWDAQQDNLYNCLTGYTYSSTETQDQDGPAEKVITRTYNSYHLQTRQETTAQGCTVIQDTEWYAEAGKSFDDQPAQFQLPKSTTTTWQGEAGERSETTYTTFDTSGNPTRQEDPDGTVTTWTYFPPEGQGADCPAEPNGFTRFTDTMTVTPRPTAYDVPAKKTCYIWAVADHTGTDVAALVMKDTERHYAGSVLLQAVSCQYGSGVTAGTLVRKDTTHYDDGKPAATTTETVTYSTDPSYPDGLCSEHTLTTHDGLAVSRKKIVSLMTGRALELRNARGLVTTLAHNSLGLITRRTHCPGTDYEKTVTCEYAFGKESDDAAFYVTRTDSLGNKVRHGLDGMGRHILTHQNDVDALNAAEAAEWYLMHQQDYDTLGRQATTTLRDYLSGQAQASDLQTQTLTYDGWGQVSKSETRDGVAACTETDPVNRVTSSWQEGNGTKSAITVTTYDVSHNPIQTKLFHAGADITTDTPYSITGAVYDGLNRLRRQTDELGQATTFEYDLRGRILNTTLPDGTVTEKTYSPLSGAPLPATISVREKGAATSLLLGSRTRDGLARLTAETVGGRTRTLEYHTPYRRHPDVIVHPDGVEETRTWIEELHEAPDTLNAASPSGTVTQAWSWNPATGALLSAADGDIVYRHTVYPSGRDQTLYADLDGETLSSTLTQYTQGGQVQTAEDYTGAEQTVERDDYGRPVTMTDDAITVSATYDGLGRVREWMVTDNQTGESQCTTLELDDLGREITRTIRHMDPHQTVTNTLVITQVWSLKHQVTQRTTTRDGQVLRDEHYTYDPARGWLLHYGVSGSAVPETPAGTALDSQTFAYDCLGNLTIMAVTDAGKMDITTYAYAYDNGDDPCQMTGLTLPDGTSVRLHYDTAGRMVQDEKGQMLTYDALGRLMAVQDAGGSTLGGWRYDASGMTAMQTSAGVTTRYGYAGSRLSYLKDNAGNSTRLSGGYAQVRQGEHAGTWLSGTDMNGSVLSVSSGDTREEYAWSPYGTQTVTAPGGK